MQSDSKIYDGSKPINLRKIVRKENIISYPFHWQVPAKTEKAAYESVIKVEKRADFEYVGFPWATLIDGLRGDARTTAELLKALGDVIEVGRTDGVRRVTVAQHIHASRFIELFKSCGITDVFWSHATHELLSLDGIRFHAFPLFPAQTPERQPGALISKRKYLANFIGAYNPHVYLTNVREAIFEDESKYSDVLIIKRDAWHFDRAVYEEQIGGRSAQADRLAVEEKHADEYLQAIEDSWFTLCPSGSGPNSIRIFESLCIGSIPIILTQSLRLPGSENLWKSAALIEDDSVEGYNRAVAIARNTTIEHRKEMLRAGVKLLSQIGPSNYFGIIDSKISHDANVA